MRCGPVRYTDHARRAAWHTRALQHYAALFDAADPDRRDDLDAIADRAWHHARQALPGTLAVGYRDALLDRNYDQAYALLEEEGYGL